MAYSAPKGWKELTTCQRTSAEGVSTRRKGVKATGEKCKKILHALGLTGSCSTVVPKMVGHDPPGKPGYSPLRGVAKK